MLYLNFDKTWLQFANICAFLYFYLLILIWFKNNLLLIHCIIWCVKELTLELKKNNKSKCFLNSTAICFLKVRSVFCLAMRFKTWTFRFQDFFLTDRIKFQKLALFFIWFDIQLLIHLDSNLPNLKHCKLQN